MATPRKRKSKFKYQEKPEHELTPDALLKQYFGDLGIRFVGVRTADVIKLEGDDGRDVDGAFVKLSPRLRRSERAAYDAAGAVAALKDRGALVVVSAPVMIPDDVAAPVEHAAPRSDPRDELRAWFGDRLDDISTAALERCLQLMDMMRF